MRQEAWISIRRVAVRGKRFRGLFIVAVGVASTTRHPQLPLPSSAGGTPALSVGRQREGMWLDDMDTGSRGAVLPAQGPLGRCLRATRLDLFLSQQQLATLAGTTQAAVSRLERGAQKWALFCRLIDAMGGRPVVTIESVGTDRMLFERYFGAEADDDYEGWAESGA